jgi:hypothetical protein
MYNFDFYDKAFEFLRGHLPGIMQHDDALTLTSDSLMSLLTDETLLYVEQQQFYDFIVNWVEFDVKNREEFFPDLFCTLNLTRIPRDVLEKEIENYPLVKKSENCQKHLLDVKMGYMTGEIKEEDGSREAILAIGGRSLVTFEEIFQGYATKTNIEVTSVFAYILAQDRWVEITRLPPEMTQPSMTFCSKKSCLYMYDSSNPNFSSKVYIYKFDLNESKWSRFILALPEDHICGNIHTILACAEKLFVIMSCHSGAQCGLWNTFVMEVNEDFPKCDMKQYLVEGNENIDVLACKMQDRYICVLSSQVSANLEMKDNSTKFVVFDTVTNRTYDQSKGAHWDTLMIPFGDELVVTSLGKSSCKIYSFATQQWRHTEEQFLPLPVNPFESTETNSISDGNSFYLLGGNDTNISESPCQMLCYNFTEKNWKELKAPPQPVQESMNSLVLLPSHLSNCHIECPHCIFSLSKLVLYDKRLS